MDIQLDWDGTGVEHDYPSMGAPNPHALRVIERLQQAGHRIIMNTMRANFKNGSLEQAIEYIENDLDHNIKVDGCNPLKIDPPRWAPAADLKELFIDDIAHSIPMRPCRLLSGFMVDWLAVEQQLEAVGILPKATVVIDPALKQTNYKAGTLVDLGKAHPNGDINLHSKSDYLGHFNKK